MTVSPGGRLGPYEIVSSLGAGGMGEVYKARDTRLDRTVAIKVLPSSLAHDPEFRARFDREAKSISALNHPHICTLYDVGETDGSAYLVLEHLEGETLAERLTRGPLPVADTLVIASQVAEALDKAHRQGIVHRDLKPANVFLVRGLGGAPHCKLLDFGLAKPGVPVTSGAFETRLATSPPPAATGAPLTAQGTILGTFQYMAPEQIEGQEADSRADIWAFGCVLYEMLTGRRAFEGKSQASLIASILERQPIPIAELQPLTPPALGRIVRTCLDKDPDNRFHTAHDLRLHLQWIEEGGSAAGIAAPVVASRKRRHHLVTTGLVLGAAALASAATWWLTPSPVDPRPVGRFSIPLPEGQAFTRTGRRVVTISPDGTKIAYIANQQIYVRSLQDLEPVAVRGTDVNPLDLVFSPDGASLAYVAPAERSGDLKAATLRRVDLAGGTPRTLAAAGGSYGVRWDGDRIVFSLGDRIVAVPDTGGDAQTLVTLAPDTADRLGQPQLLNDGRTLIYTTYRLGGAVPEGKVLIKALPDGEPRVLTDGADGRVLPTGHLIWARENVLYGQSFDRSTLQLSGSAAPLLERVRYASTTGSSQLAVSDTGVLVHLPAGDPGPATLAWVDRKGNRTPTGLPPDHYAHPRISPDGRRVVMDTTPGGVADILIWDIERNTVSKATSGASVDGLAVWTPDGRSLVYVSAPDLSTTGDLYRRAADGTGSVERLTSSQQWHFPQMVLPDGRILARITAGRTRLFLIPPEAGGKPEQLVDDAIPNQHTGAVSPDGRWLAYASTEGSTRSEIHVRPFPKTDDGHWRISSDTGYRPVWSRSGRELFYHAANPDRLMRVEVLPPGPGGAFASGNPSVLMNLAGYRNGSPFASDWDITLDDQRFLMVTLLDVDESRRSSLTVVTNWFDELRSRVKEK
jgi:Tol biopolymer transport system component